MNRIFVHTCLVAAVLPLVACGTQTSNGALPESTVTVTDVSTTVPWQMGAAQAAWDDFIKVFAVQDVSAISESECGVYAMLVTEESLTFYEWNGKQWSNVSDRLGTSRGNYPLKVYSQDFTNDGIIDFFVTYEDDKRRGGSTYGAFFAFPWSGKNRCTWAWVDVDNGRDITKTVISPDVDQRKGLVYASGYRNRRVKTFGEVKYLPSSSSFVFEEVFKK